MFNSRGRYASVYEETHLDQLIPPGQPRALSDLCNDQLPCRGILDKLSTPGEGGDGGDGFAPTPPTCPLPGLHTLRVVNPRLVLEPTAGRCGFLRVEKIGLEPTRA